MALDRDIQGSARSSFALGAAPAKGGQCFQPVHGILGPAQRRVMFDLARGEEGAFFTEAAERLADTIAHMPKPYEQNGRGDEAIAYLHYFTAGADFYLTEKDAGGSDDQPEDFQTQAFGLAGMGGEWELGYLCLPEILRAGAEIDLHFAPSTLAAIKALRV